MPEFYHSVEEMPARLLAATHRFLDDSCIVAITDLHGAIVYANDAFCRISGYGRDELLGQNHRILKSGRHTPEFYRKMWRTIASGSTWTGEICNRARDGHLYWVESTMTPLKDESGRTTHYCALRIDITARKEAQQRLIDAMEQNAERRHLESVGRMADGILHDLNNLLGGAIMLTDLGDTGEEAAEMQRGFLKRMAQLIRNVRDFSAGRSVELRSCDAARVLNESFRLAAFAAGRGRSIAFEIDTAPVCGCMIKVNEAQVLEVLLNLLTNAAEALKGAATPAVRVAAFLEPSRRTLYVDVQDNGPGVPAEIAARLFQPFVSSKGRGRGVGLAAARRLAQAMDGDLVLLPSTRGACFRFSLPLAVAEVPVPAEVSAPGGSRDAGVVLLADDDRSFLATLEATLQQHGFNTITVVEADDAIVKADQFRGCLTAAVLDSIGNIREFNLVGVLRSIQPELPIVLVSGSLSPAGIRETQHGPVHILPKPFSTADLVALLRSSVSRPV